MRPLLTKGLAIDALNDVHDRVLETATSETLFPRILELLGASYEVANEDLDRIPRVGPVVVVSNHPLGGLDGIMLAALLRRCRPDVKLMANFLLKKVRYAEDHMFFVDPFPREQAKRANFTGLRDSLRHLKDGGLLGIFPGNRVSYWQWNRWCVCDQDWAPNIAQFIRRAAPQVVPIFIEGRNSALFSVAGAIHPLLRTLLLPREMIRRSRNPRPVRFIVGNAIPFARLKRLTSDADLANFLRMSTYLLRHRPQAPAVAAPTVPQPVTDAISGALSPENIEADIRALPPEAKLLTQGEFEAYIGTWQQLPHVMQEIGRGREVSFRAAGGGTGKALDLAPQDEHYHHIFLWHKTDRTVVGAYRLGLVDAILPKHGVAGLVCSGLFELKPALMPLLKQGVELGRSYVLPTYQRSYNALLVLWGAILRFVAREPRYRMMFGSVGISQGDEYAPASRAVIVEFLRSQHSSPLSAHVAPRFAYEGMSFEGLRPDEVRTLAASAEETNTVLSTIESDGKGVPILLKHYLRMNAKMLSFGIWRNHGNALVSFILADLTTSDAKLLRRYMGDDGYEAFMAWHHATPPPESAEPPTEASPHNPQLDN
ncbi:MAG: lysophospholipid acyltransferase family protein [Roseimicrobium sp.]